MKKTLLIFFSGIMILCSFPKTGKADPSNCDGLLLALSNAMSAYEKATGKWRQATVKVSQAEFEASEAKKNLDRNDKAQREALAELDSAKADQSVCEQAAEGNLGALTDCSKVKDRISKAEKKYNDSVKANKELEDALTDKQRKLDEREQEAANAHNDQLQAYADREAAKKAAADCHKGV